MRNVNDFLICPIPKGNGKRRKINVLKLVSVFCRNDRFGRRERAVAETKSVNIVCMIPFGIHIC